jgi:hypothetical protein
MDNSFKAAAIVATLALLGGCANMPEPLAKAGDDFRQFFSRMKDSIRDITTGSPSDTQGASRADAMKKYGYDARKGPLLEIEESGLVPDSVPPGGSVEASLRFTGLAPDGVQPIKITESRAVIVDGDAIQLGQPRQREYPQGTHTSTFKLTMPKSMPKGRYPLVTNISDGKNTKTFRNTFTIL